MHIATTKDVILILAGIAVILILMASNPKKSEEKERFHGRFGPPKN